MSRLKTLIVSFAFLHSGMAVAAASGSVVFDPTNLVQNTSSAINSSKQVLEQIQQTKQQIMMVKNQVDMVKKMANDVRGLDVKDLRQFLDPKSSQLLRDLTGAQKSYGNVLSNLQDLQSRYKSKIAAAASSGNPLDVFLARQHEEALNGSVAAKRILDRDIQVLKSTEVASKAADAWRDKIGGLNDNLGGSMQLLNTQMTAVVAGNAETLAYMARVNSEAAQRALESSERSIDKSAALVKSQDEYRAAEAAAREANKKSNGGYYNPWGSK